MCRLLTHANGGAAAVYPDPCPPPGFPGPYFAPRLVRPPPPPRSPASPGLASPTYQNQQQGHFQRQPSPFQPPPQQQPFNPAMQPGLCPPFQPHFHGGFPPGSPQQQLHPRPSFQQQLRPLPQRALYTPFIQEPVSQQQHGVPAHGPQRALQHQQQPQLQPQPQQPYYERLVRTLYITHTSDMEWHDCHEVNGRVCHVCSSGSVTHCAYLAARSPWRRKLSESL